MYDFCIKENGQDVSEARCTFYPAPTSTCITQARQCAAHAGNSRHTLCRPRSAIPKHPPRAESATLGTHRAPKTRCLGTHRARSARLRRAVSTRSAPTALNPARRVMPQSKAADGAAGPRLARLPPAAGSCSCLPPHAARLSQRQRGRQTQPSGSAPPIPFPVCGAGS